MPSGIEFRVLAVVESLTSVPPARYREASPPKLKSLRNPQNVRAAHFTSPMTSASAGQGSVGHSCLSLLKRATSGADWLCRSWGMEFFLRPYIMDFSALRDRSWRS